MSNIGTVEVEDGTGTAKASLAQQGDIPTYQEYTYPSSTTFSYQFSTSDRYTGMFSDYYTITLPQNAILEDDPSVSANVVGSYQGLLYDTAYSVSAWNHQSSWPAQPTTCTLNVTGYFLEPYYGYTVYVTVTGNQGQQQPAYVSGYYELWQPNQNPPTVKVVPGVIVAPTSVVTTTSNGSSALPTLVVTTTSSTTEVPYSTDAIAAGWLPVPGTQQPTTFTTGGQSPGTSLSYTFADIAANGPLAGTAVPSDYMFPLGSTTITATATDGSDNTSTANFVVDVIQIPSAVSTTDDEAIVSADQFANTLANFIEQNRDSGNVGFAGSYAPAAGLLDSLATMAQYDAAAMVETLPDVDQTAFNVLQSALSQGQAQSSFIQQQALTLNDDAALVVHSLIAGGTDSLQLPSLNVPSASVAINENSSFIFAGSDAIGMADSGGNSNDEQLTLSVEDGTLTLPGSAEGGSGTRSLTISGTLSVIKADLAQIVYQPFTDFSGTDTLTLAPVDTTDQAQGLLAQIVITVNPPMLSVPTQVSVNEDSSLPFSGSNAINVTDTAGGGTALAFTSVPPSGTVNTSVSAPLTVSVLNGFGTIISGDSSTVTLSIASGPGTFAAGSTTSVAASNGVATFSNLSFTTPGTYTLLASDGTLAGAVSTPIVIGSNSQNGGNSTIVVNTTFDDSLTTHLTLRDAIKLANATSGDTIVLCPPFPEQSR